MCGFFGKAAEAAAAIIKAFEDPNSLPGPLATLFIKRQDNIPCRKWSWRNQLLVALAGHTDARGFRQWQEMNRFVKKGERAFQILAPILKTVRDGGTGEERQVVVGFKGVPVFGYSQTNGPPLPAGDPEAERWVESLPLVEVARSWGLSVEVFEGDASGALGLYRRRGNKGIALGVKNLRTWAHEMIHAADDRLGHLTEFGQHWRSETVADLGGAVLLRILGHDEESDLGGVWTYIRAYSGRAKVEPVEACGRVLDRTCQAVALVLTTAEELKPVPTA